MELDECYVPAGALRGLADKAVYNAGVLPTALPKTDSL